MSQIDQLIRNYRHFAGLPWQKNLSPSQRIWFAVYPPIEERRLRAHIQEFEVVTSEAGHQWKLIDVSIFFESWISKHDYRDAYFADPEALMSVADEDVMTFVAEKILAECTSSDVDNKTVVAVLGAGGLFGFTHVSSVLAKVEADIRGRLLIFFPGEYDKNRYRFMDARDGFNYMAVPITCSERVDI